MFFTQEDYRKIEKWLLANSRKDTEFAGAATPLKGNETVVLVQNGKNVNVLLKDLIEQIFLLGVSDFLNVTDKYGESRISLTQAIQLIPYKSRKIGQVITFLDEDGEWKLFQFQGERVSQWNNATLWVDLIKRIQGISIIDSEDITATVDNLNQTSLTFADKNYNTTDYSGLGRVYLRKNIQRVQNPNTGIFYNTNLLTQQMISKENTIYIIQYDYNLNGQTITIPEGCVLQFEGGSIQNGTITNYIKFIKASSLGLKEGLNNAALNAKLFINYVNCGIKIELDGTYHFHNSTEAVIINDLYIKNGKFINTHFGTSSISYKTINIAKGCSVISFENVYFDTTLPKVGRLINEVFRVDSTLNNTPYIETFYINNCTLDGVRLYTHSLNDFDYTLIPCGIKEYKVSDCYIKNNLHGVIYISDCPIGNAVINNNIIFNMSRGVFLFATENTYINKPITNSLIFSNNIAENNEIKQLNDNWGTQYFTPLLAEGFNTIVVKDNVFRNLIIDSKNEQVYCFYIAATTVHIENNTEYNIFNIARQDLNEAFKNKSGVSKYVENNSYIIDKEYLIKNYNELIDYDFESIQVQFMSITALNTESNPLGNYVVNNNTMIIPGTIYFMDTQLFVSKDMFFTNNTLKCNSFRGAIFCFKPNQSGISVFFENNILKAEPVNSIFSIFWIGDNTNFNLFIRGNELYRTRLIFTGTDKSTSLIENNNMYNTHLSAFTDSNNLGYNTICRNNKIINPEGMYSFFNISNSNNADVEFELPEILGYPFFTIFSNNGLTSPVKIEYTWEEDNHKVEGAMLISFNIEARKATVKLSSLFEYEFNLFPVNATTYPGPELEYNELSNARLSINPDGKLNFIAPQKVKNFKVHLIRNADIDTTLFPSVMGAFSTRNTNQFEAIKPSIRYTLFSRERENYVYNDKKDWRNIDGTLLSKVIII